MIPNPHVSFGESIPITPDHHLLLSCLNLDSADDITIRYWILLEDGRLQMIKQTIRAASGSKTDGVFPLPFGQLLSAQIHADNIIHQMGRCLVYAAIRFGPATTTAGAPIESFKTLISDYVTQLSAPSWPPVNMGMNPARIAPSAIIGTSPAAGAVYQYTCPDYTLMEILSVKCRFVTDANAANRRVSVIIRDSGSNSLARAVSATNQAASTTRFYFFGQGFGNEVGDSTTNVSYSEPLNKIWLYDGMILEISPPNIQAGDQIDQIAILANVQAVR